MRTIWLAIMLLLSSVLSNAQTCQDIFGTTDSVDASAFIRTPFLDPEETDHLTLVVMQQIRHQQENYRDNVAGWLRSIGESQDSHPLSALEYTGLLLIEKENVFAENSEYEGLLKDALTKAYQHLVGRPPSEGTAWGALPDSVLNNSPLRAKLFHEALFPYSTDDEGRNKTRDRSFVGNVKRVVTQTKQMIRAAPRHFNAINAVTTILLVAALCYEPGRAFFFGALTGLAEAAANENTVHLGIGHASITQARKFRLLGPAGQFVETINLSHRLHHALVNFGFAVAELSPEQKARAYKILRIMAANLVFDQMRDKYPGMSRKDIFESDEHKKRTEELVDTVANGGNFGVDGSVLGATAMVLTATPYYLADLAIFYATGSPIFLISSTLSLTVWAVQSLYSHRYLHYGADTAAKVGGNSWQLWFVNNTPIGRLSRRLHFKHHSMPFPKEQAGNGVIMGFSVHDRISGNLQHLNIDDLLEMYFQNLLPEMQRDLHPELDDGSTN